MVGYALARLRFLGKKMLYTLILFTMTIPFQIVLIPQYILMVKLGWTDTYLALVAPAMMSAFASYCSASSSWPSLRRSSTRPASTGARSS